MDPTGYVAKILTKMPKANNFTTGDGLNYANYRYLRTRRGNSGGAVTIGTDTETDRKQINLKIDQNFTANHKLGVSWSYERNDTFNDQPNWPDGLPYYTQRYPQVFTANLTSTLSSSLLNEGRFGIRYSNANVAAPHEVDYYPNKETVDEALKWTLPVAGYNVTVDLGVAGGQGLQSSQFGGSANGIFDATPGQYNGNVSSLYNYADTLSWTRGKHAFKFGGEWRATKSVGYNNIPRIPFARISGGAGGNVSGLATTTVVAPATTLRGNNRTNAVNMLYFLAGSVNNVESLYWIDDSSDIEKGHWEDVTTKKRKFRDVIQNEAGIFFKDDWKITKNLTLNLGLRWDMYPYPYIGSGFTTTAVGQGGGLFGIGRDGTADLFDNWLRPGAVYLSGYGPNAGASGLSCTTGVSNGALLPVSSCDPSKLTTVEFVGPNTPNPNKSAARTDYNNFGPAIGFSYNANWFGETRPTTIRGGYQLTYGGSGREVGGGGATSNEVVIGGAPGALNSATTVTADFSNEYLDLTDVAKLVPVRPGILPGGTIPIYNGATAFSAMDPNFVTPYVQNFTLSATTNLSRRLTMDLRYIGTVSKKQQGTVPVNTNNVFYNKELFDALTITRAGGDASLFDQMLAGLNLNSGVTANPGPNGTTFTVAYGPIGTCIAQPTGSTMPGLGKEGCAANAVMQHGSAHLRRNGTFQDNLANGNFAAVAASLTGNGSTLPAVGANGGFLQLPDTDPNTAGVQVLTGVAERRLLRNGCDRLGAGLTNIATRCFAENYFEANPQLGAATFITNNATSNYHSLQTQLTLRPTAGLSVQGTYTWSKNLGYGSDNFSYNDPLCRACDYSYTNNDRKHDFRTNGTFELPIGPNKLLMGNSSGWIARVLERWQTSVIYNWTSGAASRIEGANMFYSSGNNTDLSTPDIVGPFPVKSGKVRWNDTSTNPALRTGTYFDTPSPFVSIDDPQCLNIVNKTDSMGFNSYVNGDCGLNALAVANPDGTPGQIIFQAPLPGRKGTLGRGVIRGLGEWSLDANISKTFRISESKNIQLRIDTTNVLNHPNLDNPELDSRDGDFGDVGGKGTERRSFQASLRFQF